MPHHVTQRGRIYIGLASAASAGEVAEQCEVGGGLAGSEHSTVGAALYIAAPSDPAKNSSNFFPAHLPR